METKQCTKCNEIKSIDSFSPRAGRKGKSATHSACKPCRVIDNQKYRKKRLQEDRDYRKHFNLKNKFNLSIYEYNKLLELQDFKCAICKRDRCSTGRAFAVDHNHETGVIRGLLCSRCNRGLGLFKDDPSYLQNAIDYLRSIPPVIDYSLTRYKRRK